LRIAYPAVVARKKSASLHAHTAVLAASELPLPQLARTLSERLSVRYDAQRLPLLLADRDPAARALFASSLTGIGHPVQVAADVSAALAMLVEPMPRIFILDVDAPGALAAVATIRASEQAQKSPYLFVVALTRNLAPGLAKEAFGVGVDDILVKPFLIEVLAYRLQVAARILALEDGLAARNRVLEEADRRHCEGLMAAAQVQRALLPPAGLVHGAVATDWCWRPSEQLGGDLLNLIPIDDRHLAFWVIDASGHGLPPALLAVQANRFLVPAPGQACLTIADGAPVPAIEVLRALNRLFPMDPNNYLYFTIAYGVIDVVTGSIDLACAAHPGPLLVSADAGWRQIEGYGNAIGWMNTSQARFSEHRLQLAAGERLYLYSDGMAELMNGEGEQFGTERLAEVLAANRGAPLAAGLAAAEQAVLDWGRGLPADAFDDLSVLGISFLP